MSRQPDGAGGIARYSIGLEIVGIAIRRDEPEQDVTAAQNR